MRPAFFPEIFFDFAVVTEVVPAVHAAGLTRISLRRRDCAGSSLRLSRASWSGLIPLPDQSQSLQRQEFVGTLYVFRPARDERRLPAGANNLHLGSHLRFQPFEHAVHPVDSA